MTSQSPAQCNACTRLRAGWTCEAFPRGIPIEIAMFGADHRQPVRRRAGAGLDLYMPLNDHGIRFEQADTPQARAAFEDWQRFRGALDALAGRTQEEIVQDVRSG